MKKSLITLIGIALVLVAFVVFFKFTDLGTSILWKASNGGAWLLPLVIVAALLDSINPCAFSILILTVAFLFGIGATRGKVLRIGGTYVFGMFIAYVLIGLGIVQTLHLFNTPHFMAKVGALLLVVLGGINLINEFFPAFPVKLKIPEAAHRKMAELMNRGSLPAAFGLGILVALCEFPCTGGPYLMILGLLHDRGTYASGLGYLMLYNLVFILPLVVLLLIASHASLVERVRAWQRKERTNMRLWGGVAMVALGIIIFFL